jgi:hypothetical protein
VCLCSYPWLVFGGELLQAARAQAAAAAAAAAAATAAAQ